MNRMSVALVLLAAPMSLSAALAADKPAAMIESVTPAAPGLNTMDYLQPGRTITLPDGATLVLDYLGSCIHETITGGTVHVGTDQSQVEHGKVVRSQVDCDGSDLQLSAAQSDAGGVAVYRTLAPPTAPTLTVSATMPVVVTPGMASVTLQRVDANEPSVDLGPPSPSGTRWTIDFARVGRSLAPGGVYRLTQGNRVLVFKVDPQAQGGSLPLVQRLLPL
ncbi:MAG TPA: hypothetical protein VJY39_08795 [Acidisphaera sp.]|nr:hypothetical protein [Acidisphaera sp.]